MCGLLSHLPFFCPLIMISRIVLQLPWLQIQGSCIVRVGEVRGYPMHPSFVDEDTELHKDKVSSLGGFSRAMSRTQVSQMPLRFSTKFRAKRLNRNPTPFFIQEKTNDSEPTTAPLGIFLTWCTGWSKVDCAIVTAHRVADLACVTLGVVL